MLCQTGVVVGAPYAGVGGYQRGAALGLDDGELETGRVYTVPGDLSWMPGSEGTQVNKSPFLSFVRTMRGRLPPSNSSQQHLELD